MLSSESASAGEAERSCVPTVRRCAIAKLPTQAASVAVTHTKITKKA